MSDNIFQEIWDADQGGNGVPALRPGEARDETQGCVVVDERATEVDAEHRVLKEVVIPADKLETYQLCERIFDNYALERAVREQVSPAETQEELDFIDAILPTPPIKKAQQFLESSLDLTISQSLMAAMIKETWFDMGIAGGQQDASGFEHVFVGEQSSKASQAGGYHFWYKYHLDDAGPSVIPGNDGQDRIQYLGTRYEKAKEPEKGVLVPEVVTLELTWHAPLGDGSHNTKRLHKPIGGFFVGCSPEGLIALGLVRCRTQSNKITRINGAEYQLDLHRLDNNRNAIRTFFPRFRRADVIDIGNGNGDDKDKDKDKDKDQPPGNTESSPFRVVAAMVNPQNPEGGREFIQIINASQQTASLLGWQVVAPNGTRFELADIEVAPGDVFKFIVPTNQGVLRNKAGTIRLRSPEGDMVLDYPYSGDQAREENQPILFG
ncbi:hypothetical protein [Adonisia turfae]|uniref:EndoU domain-containing protein n=1 Tax=Adonisia turfae CCMR0081 TaxID=2292702 RepID=A0A6M0RPH6_9CYAN|nr:hypothetical protein [Adonisia turfae]NEZ58168.1 hypothetical protein [Adonisia turfae CCMR0081]